MDIDLSYYKKRYQVDDGRAFEWYCKDLLEISGFKDLIVTNGSGDYGVDIICTYAEDRYAIQCKYYSGKVGNHSVEEVYSGGNYYRCNRFVVMTNNTFTEQAKEQAKKLGVILLDEEYFLDRNYYTYHSFSINTLYQIQGTITIEKDIEKIEDLRFSEDGRFELPFKTKDKNTIAVFTNKTIIDWYYLYQDENKINIEYLLDFFVAKSKLNVRAFGYYKYLEGVLYFYLDKVVLEGASR